MEVKPNETKPKNTAEGEFRALFEVPGKNEEKKSVYIHEWWKYFQNAREMKDATKRILGWEMDERKTDSDLPIRLKWRNHQICEVMAQGSTVLTDNWEQTMGKDRETWRGKKKFSKKDQNIRKRRGFQHEKNSVHKLSFLDDYHHMRDLLLDIARHQVWILKSVAMFEPQSSGSDDVLRRRVSQLLQHQTTCNFRSFWCAFWGHFMRKSMTFMLF